MPYSSVLEVRVRTGDAGDACALFCRMEKGDDGFLLLLLLLWT